MSLALLVRSDARGGLLSRSDPGILGYLLVWGAVKILR